MVTCIDTFLVTDSPNDFVGVISLIMIYANSFQIEFGTNSQIARSQNDDI